MIPHWWISWFMIPILVLDDCCCGILDTLINVMIPDSSWWICEGEESWRKTIDPRNCDKSYHHTDSVLFLVDVYNIPLPHLARTSERSFQPKKNPTNQPIGFKSPSLLAHCLNLVGFFFNPACCHFQISMVIIGNGASFHQRNRKKMAVSTFQLTCSGHFHQVVWQGPNHPCHALPKTEDTSH